MPDAREKPLVREVVVRQKKQLNWAELDGSRPPSKTQSDVRRRKEIDPRLALHVALPERSGGTLTDDAYVGKLVKDQSSVSCVGVVACRYTRRPTGLVRYCVCFMNKPPEEWSLPAICESMVMSREVSPRQLELLLIKFRSLRLQLVQESSIVICRDFRQALVTANQVVAYPRRPQTTFTRRDESSQAPTPATSCDAALLQNHTLSVVDVEPSPQQATVSPISRFAQSIFSVFKISKGKKTTLFATPEGDKPVLKKPPWWSNRVRNWNLKVNSTLGK
eukprot:GHVS01045564.1.p1 GENE.GHVS01045564.1~~GHVS01045564.1.p1  ORF type:complete len:277 (-),score=40.85 GHVS01045564.1:388-1218(-)